MTTTTVLFTTPGYLPGVYSIEIDGEEFAELWERFCHLRAELDSPRFDRLGLTLETSEDYELAVEDTKNTDEFRELLSEIVKNIAAFHLWYDHWQFLEGQPTGTVIPWELRFIYKHPFTNGRELAELFWAVGWNAPVVVGGGDFMEKATGLQITEHAFYLV